jgi:predicted RNase H-like HicB family nuclease
MRDAIPVAVWHGEIACFKGKARRKTVPFTAVPRYPVLLDDMASYTDGVLEHDDLLSPRRHPNEELLMSGQRGFVKFSFKLPMLIKQEGEWHYAVCPALDVHSQGLTREEAKINLMEAVQLFIESCFQRRVLDDVLMDCGFETADDNTNDNGAEMLEMTLPLLARRHAEAHAR